MKDFEQLIEGLDPALFDSIYCQLFPDDKRSLLAIQKAIRLRLASYTYLEIGSYLGGSLQTHVIDPRCRKIYSIDKRPAVQADDRGFAMANPDNSSERMMSLLRALSEGGARKVSSFDAEAGNLDAGLIDQRPDLLFVDGEHTEQAVLKDFDFCRKVAAGRAVICFHDSNIVFTALQRIVDALNAEGTPFHAYCLPSYIFVVELGGSDLYTSQDLQGMLIDNYRAYLPSLMSMEHYREVYNTLPVRFLRAISRRLKPIGGRAK